MNLFLLLLLLSELGKSLFPADNLSSTCSFCFRLLSGRLCGLDGSLWPLLIDSKIKVTFDLVDVLTGGHSAGKKAFDVLSAADEAFINLGDRALVHLV